MRYRELPVITKIKALEEQKAGDGKAFQDSIALDLFKTPGMQLVMGALQVVEGEALTALRSGKGSPERLAGAIEATDKIRGLLVALLPTGVELAEAELEEEVESEDLYSSGFNIPFPNGTSPET